MHLTQQPLNVLDAADHLNNRPSLVKAAPHISHAGTTPTCIMRNALRCPTLRIWKDALLETGSINAVIFTYTLQSRCALTPNSRASQPAPTTVAGPRLALRGPALVPPMRLPRPLHFRSYRTTNRRRRIASISFNVSR